MSEAVLDLDSGAEGSSPDTGSSSEQPTNEVELFTDDTPAPARDNGNGNSNGETSDFDPERHDWLRGDVDAVPEQYRGLVPLAKNLQAQFTRTQQDLAEQRRELQTAYIDSQVQEARGEYGGDLDNYTDQIVATVRINNPQTGQPYTVREAYELHAGITAQKAAELRQNDSQARKSSKRAVRSSSGVDASEETGPMTDNEVLSGLANLGFD
jgi:hypothetical protein